jgi:hypothetical protein
MNDIPSLQKEDMMQVIDSGLFKLFLAWTFPHRQIWNTGFPCQPIIRLHGPLAVLFEPDDPTLCCARRTKDT